jgi:hypothetical protein
VELVAGVQLVAAEVSDGPVKRRTAAHARMAVRTMQAAMKPGPYGDFSSGSLIGLLLSPRRTDWVKPGKNRPDAAEVIHRQHQNGPPSRSISHQSHLDL